MKIELNNVSKCFGHDQIIHNISLSFSENHIYGIVGDNGSGKSVLLKLIAGLYKPSTGIIKVNNINFNMEESFPRDMGVVIDKPLFVEDLSGIENLSLLADINKKIGSDDILWALEIVNLTKEKDKKYHKYSMGMRQKLAIAQSIMEHQKILLLDEPFNGIERETVIKIKNYLLQNKKDHIIIITSHIHEDLSSFADVIYKMIDGELIKDDKE